MVRMICLDGVNIALAADRVEIDIRGSGLRPCSVLDEAPAIPDWQPIMSFHDGSTLFLHCPPEGEEEPLGYRVEGPNPHRWNITLLPGEETVARLGWEAC